MTLLGAPSDPLGLIAAQAATYEGKFYNDLADISDEERRRYLADMQLTKLAMPLESVMLNFSIEGVTRGFTHQMVRQRTAAYAQESQRFAVVEDSFTDRVALPPELAKAKSLLYWDAEATAEVDNSGRHFPHDADRDEEIDRVRQSLVERYGTDEDKLRYRWEFSVIETQKTYKYLVDNGLPAESARGLLPTNITTRIKYNTNLRSLLDHAGNRLCTQAQFEWREVFYQIANAIRAYGRNKKYWAHIGTIRGGTMQPLDETGKPFGSLWNLGGGRASGEVDSQWQFDAIADLFKPVCYQQNKCPMKASFDRKCSIRDRVDLNAALGRPSSEWHERSHGDDDPECQDPACGIPPIFPAEWLLNPGAAR